LKLLTNFEKPFSSNPLQRPYSGNEKLTGSRLLISNSLIWVIKKLRKKVIDKTGRQKVQNPKNSKLK
jgi:hypothetical protein